MDLFKELLPSLLQGREPILEDDKDYVPYIINKALSAHIDIILYANEMNLNYNLDKRLQHDYLFHSIRKRKRTFQPWLKRSKNDELNAVKEYFGYSMQKTKETINILTSEQVKEIVTKIKSKDNGGVK